MTDFGGAKSIIDSDNYQKTLFTGTPNWMAPESVKKNEYTRFSDIWSLGCLVLEMATGEPPWSNYKNPMAVLYQLYNSNKPPPIPDEIPILCKDFISKCLVVDPNKRYNIHQLLNHEYITNSDEIILSNYNSNPNSLIQTELRVSLDKLDKNFGSKSSLNSDSLNNTIKASNTDINDKSKLGKNFFSDPLNSGLTSIDLNRKEEENNFTESILNVTNNDIKLFNDEKYIIEEEKQEEVLIKINPLIISSSND